MRSVVRMLLLPALVVAGFGAGYWVRDSRGPSNAQMEDYALSNILGEVAYAAFLAKGDTAQLRDLVDVNLNGHIRRVVQFQGSVSDPQFEASKIRTLNAAARLWDQRPPFSAMAERASDPAAAHWIDEWKATTAKNMQLLDWAKNQCATNPTLKCATGPIGK